MEKDGVSVRSVDVRVRAREGKGKRQEGIRSQCKRRKKVESTAGRQARQCRGCVTGAQRGIGAGQKRAGGQAGRQAGKQAAAAGRQSQRKKGPPLPPAKRAALLLRCVVLGHSTALARTLCTTHAQHKTQAVPGWVGRVPSGPSAAQRVSRPGSFRFSLELVRAGSLCFAVDRGWVGVVRTAMRPALDQGAGAYGTHIKSYHFYWMRRCKCAATMILQSGTRTLRCLSRSEGAG